MKKALTLIENGNGNFNIKDFGTHIAGVDGKESFDLIIKSSDRQVDVVIPGVHINDLFSRFDVNGEHFKAGIYFSTDFIKVIKSRNQICLEVTKKLFSLFEQSAEHNTLQVKSEPRLTVATGAKIQTYQKTILKAA